MRVGWVFFKHSANIHEISIMLWHVLRASQCFAVHTVLGKPSQPQGKRLPQIIDALIRPKASHGASDAMPVVPERCR